LIATSHGTNREAFTPGDWGLFVSLSLIWGASFLFMAIGLDSFHPGLVTWLRVGFGAAFMFALPRARKAKVESSDWKTIVLLAFIWIALPLTLFPIAQQWVNSAVAGMLNGATPIFTAVLATILHRALPGRLQIAGLLIGLAGIVGIALPSAGAGASEALGVVLIIIATVCYAFSLNMVPPLQQKYGSLGLIARVQWAAALMVVPFGIFGLTESTFSWPALLATLAVGVVGTGLAFVLMGSLSGRVGATRAAFITYAIPVVALILGVAFRDDIVAPVAIVGVALVIVGALLASRSEL